MYIYIYTLLSAVRATVFTLPHTFSTSDTPCRWAKLPALGPVVLVGGGTPIASADDDDVELSCSTDTR